MPQYSFVTFFGYTKTRKTFKFTSTNCSIGLNRLYILAGRPLPKDYREKTISLQSIFLRNGRLEFY